ncbi:MAG: HD domain-containing protein [Thermotoga sp.]|nr:HD domain-containing protein [Thermotoga sp.]
MKRLLKVAPFSLPFVFGGWQSLLTAFLVAYALEILGSNSFLILLTLPLALINIPLFYVSIAVLSFAVFIRKNPFEKTLLFLETLFVSFLVLFSILSAIKEDYIPSFLAIFAFSLLLLEKKWRKKSEESLQKKTEELSAVNQELTALNQQLTAVNQELEASYESLQVLSNQLNRMMEIMGEIDLEIDPFPILEKVFYDSRKLVEPLSGLAVKNSKQEFMVGKKTESFLQKRSKNSEVKLFISRKLERDEETFLKSIMNFSLFLLRAHDSYCEVLENRNTLSHMLTSLEEVLVVSNRTELLEKMLHYLRDILPGIVLSSISMLEDNKLTTFFLRDEKVEKTNLNRGIVMRAFRERKDILIEDVKDFPEFFDVTGGKARSAAAVFFEYEDMPFVIEVEKEAAFSEFEFSTLKMMARVLSIFLSRLNLYRKLRSTFFQTIEAFSYAMELKDPYTSGHSLRVSKYAQEIARRMGLSKHRIERIRIAALLHDIGKIGMRGAILNKTSKLTKEEYEEVKKHPELGEKLISKVEDFSDIAKIVRHHHEWYGGGGYPDNLSGEEIPLESRIIAIADAFDAMTSDRPYRKAMNKNTALEILRKNEGLQWDPLVLKVALSYFSEL